MIPCGIPLSLALRCRITVINGLMSSCFVSSDFELRCEGPNWSWLTTSDACVLFCVSEKLKFTPTPQPAQCLELDNQITIQCSAKGRENPTIHWTKAGVCTSSVTSKRLNSDGEENVSDNMQWVPFSPLMLTMADVFTRISRNGA